MRKLWLVTLLVVAVLGGLIHMSMAEPATGVSYTRQTVYVYRQATLPAAVFHQTGAGHIVDFNGNPTPNLTPPVAGRTPVAATPQAWIDRSGQLVLPFGKAPITMTPTSTSTPTSTPTATP